jgi:signal transduction histidine kinase
MMMRRMSSSSSRGDLVDPKRWVETALQATADGMIFVDRVGRVSFLNPAAERLTGWTSTAAAGRSLAEVLQPVHVESGAPLPLPLAQAMAEGDALPLPAGAALHSGAGEPMAIDGAVLPVVDERGRVDGAVILMHDVSERRNTRERLLSADRLASIGVLAAGVGHEINNPLTTVVANLEAATHELHEPQHDVNRIDHALIEARDGAEKVARIVKQLRGWAREASSTDDRPKVLELLPVVEGAVAMSAAVIRARARLVKDYGAAPPVLAGEARLGQLLTILLLNTARSLPEGRPHENEIRVAIGHDERGAAVIEVNDSGKSVRDELGLATVRSLVAALGGPRRGGDRSGAAGAAGRPPRRQRCADPGQAADRPRRATGAHRRRRAADLRRRQARPRPRLPGDDLHQRARGAGQHRPPATPTTRSSSICSCPR